MKAITLFSGAGIDEFYLKDCGIEVILANEIISARAEAYKQLHENQNVMQHLTRYLRGDIMLVNKINGGSRYEA